eukprot:06890_1
MLSCSRSYLHTMWSFLLTDTRESRWPPDFAFQTKQRKDDYKLGTWIFVYGHETWEKITRKENSPWVLLLQCCGAKFVDNLRSAMHCHKTRTITYSLLVGCRIDGSPTTSSPWGCPKSTRS